MDAAVVTGARRGIGRATAFALGRRGLALALLGRASPGLEALADELCALGVVARAYACDVASEAEVAAAAAAVVSDMGVPRVVVNNAGVVHRNEPVAQASVAAWDHVLAVNLRGSFLVTRAFLPGMIARAKGRIVYISSISATLGSPGAASYSASKWGVVGLMKSVAEELRGTGLQALAVLPGSVDTDMLKGSGFSPQMSADDVANTVVYAALDAPAALTGSAIEMFG